MSDIDDNDDFMHDDDLEEDYDFEYEDSETEEPDIDLENKYYNAKSKKQDSPQEALQNFLEIYNEIISKETNNETGLWAVKALKQYVKLSFKLGLFDNVLSFYCKLLGCFDKFNCGKNYVEKSVNNLLEFVQGTENEKFLEEFYEITLREMKGNGRLTFKCNLKLAKVWLDKKDMNKLKSVLKKLKDSCDDERKGTNLLEIYALEIQMYTETKNNKKLKELYNLCLQVKSAIPHPRVMGIVRECGGKMHMKEKNWDQAQKDFFEAFKNYDEAGCIQRISCLKYLVLANMLTESQINPFDSQETKPYKNDPQIVVMTNLVSAFQRKDIGEFEKILKDEKRVVFGDGFIKMYIDDVLKNIRNQVLVQLIGPYQSISIEFLAKHLGVGVSEKEVYDLLIGLILEGKVDGRIDQVRGVLELEQNAEFVNEGFQKDRVDAMNKWVDVLYGQLNSLTIK